MQAERLKRLFVYGALGTTACITALRLYREFTRFDVRDKVILITGGSRGLGFALAKLLAQRGARLALCARSPEHLGQAQIELEQAGAEVATFVTDVSKPGQVQKLLRDVMRHYGQLDVLINNAGIIQVSPQEALDLTDFEQTMKTNFWASLYTMFAAIPIFKKQGEGRIVNITSIGGKIAVPHLLPYTASKFALVGLSEGMHASLKKHNITVTTVVPGLMRTGSPMHADFKGDHDKEYAWFKISDSSSLLSVSSARAAQEIVQAIEYGKAEAVIGWTSRAAMALQGLLPGPVSGLLTLVNNLLPGNAPGGAATEKGYTHETKLSRALGMSSDLAAAENNQLL
jgi:short-subunit dehydrogenase